MACSLPLSSGYIVAVCWFHLHYTIIPMHEVVPAYCERQFEKAEFAAAQQKAKAKAEKLGIQFIPAGDGQSA